MPKQSFNRSSSNKEEKLKDKDQKTINQKEKRKKRNFHFEKEMKMRKKNPEDAVVNNLNSQQFLVIKKEMKETEAIIS